MSLVAAFNELRTVALGIKAERDEAVSLLHLAYAEMRRWKSCQNIGACRQCVDDGLLLQLKTRLEDCSMNEGAKIP